MLIIAKTNEKLIKFLIHNVQGLSFASAQKLLRKGDIKVNGKRVKQNIDITPLDQVEIYMPKASMPTVPIIYEDDNILIINKPAGIECATRDKSSSNTFSLEEIFKDKNAIVVHRLDRLTEGLVILAKITDVAREFEKIFRQKQVKKTYITAVTGNFDKTGIQKAYLFKNANKALVDISDTEKEGYKEIVTEFEIIQKLKDVSILKVTLHTGRTHQIRAHCNYLGHPIINDTKYNRQTITIDKYKGYFLTAYKLDFDLSGNMSYLNDVHLQISPSWTKYLEEK